MKISLIGALVNLDDVPLLQIMISQPIVIAPLIGFLWGDFQTGLIIGAFLELLMINYLPIGCAVPLDSSIGAVVAIGTFFLITPFFPSSRNALIALVVLVSMPFTIIAQKASILVRKFNGRLSTLAQESAERGDLRKLDFFHFTGVGLFYLRSFCVCFISIYFIAVLAKLTVYRIPAGAFRGLELLYTLLPIIGIAMIFDTFKNKSLYGLFSLSFFLSLLLITLSSLPGVLSFCLTCLICGGLLIIQQKFFKSKKV